MAWLRAMGGLKKSTTFIVKDGVVQIEFDPTVYRRATGYNVVGTQWAYDSQLDCLKHGVPSVANANGAYSTNNKIDVTDFSTMHVVGRAIQTGNWVTVDIDITSVIGSVYVIIDAVRTSTAVILYTSLATAKQDYSASALSDNVINSTTTVSTTNTLQLKDIWFD